MSRSPMYAHRKRKAGALSTPSVRAQRGALIIELMVGIVMALLIGLAATSNAMMYGASHRQSISSGSMTINMSTIMA